MGVKYPSGSTTLNVATIVDNLPNVNFKDTDGVDADINAQIGVNLTDTGSGTEDADLTIRQQIAGVLTDVIVLDADGVAQINKDLTLKDTGTVTLAFKDDDATDDDVNASITVNLTDTGSGAEDADISINQQIAGVLTEVVAIDADGVLQIQGKNATIKNTTAAILNFKDDDCTDDDVNASITVNCTDTGSGAEDADLTIASQVNGASHDWIQLDASAAKILVNDSTEIASGKQLFIPDGSVSAVSLCLAGDADTGIYGSANAWLALAVQGVQTLEMSSTNIDARLPIRTSLGTGGFFGIENGTVSSLPLRGTADANTGLYLPAADTIGIAGNGKLCLSVTDGESIIKGTTSAALSFKDDDATDDDVNASIVVNLTDTGSGAEDADISIKQQVAGTLTEVALIDADGSFVINKAIKVVDGSQGTSGHILKSSDTGGTATWAANLATSGITIDGGGSAITTGVKGYVEVPYAGVITNVTMLADQSGSIVVDIWKDTYANYPPTDADSITASAVPTISAATKSKDSTLTGWTTTVAAGDILGFNVDSASTVTRVSLVLTIRKT